MDWELIWWICVGIIALVFLGAILIFGKDYTISEETLRRLRDEKKH